MVNSREDFLIDRKFFFAPKLGLCLKMCFENSRRTERSPEIDIDLAAARSLASKCNEGNVELLQSELSALSQNFEF